MGGALGWETDEIFEGLHPPFQVSSLSKLSLRRNLICDLYPPPTPPAEQTTRAQITILPEHTFQEPEKDCSFDLKVWTHGCS